ncbi:DEAD/DEAH box helicase [Microvirga tunisiensis]|uniref:DEAD/DEAH box helicase n=1 Tax=Microvirga tunisiensis TaxID=2108360 RepID=A0A5N7MB36_9HYPH|nr:DEAD/DEAH box helicase family protein [Microvirga tunisiensis]MPR05650.1 DEAD/DEAH box helicase [Microvirga tunisiensis]MPR23850.1 DEAD/DEAH box helicase [Microvirga tunisiensis]
MSPNASQTPAFYVNPKARELQERIASEIIDAVRNGEDVLLIAPTGGGKTWINNRVAAAISDGDRLQDGISDSRVLVLQGLRRIASQNSQKSSHSGIDPDRTAVAMDGNILGAKQADVVYALPQTIASRMDELGHFALIQIDECHHTTDEDPASEYSRVIDEVTKANPGAVIVGTTATPFRGDGASLHPRLASARRIVMTYAEAIKIGQITEVPTVTPDYPLKNGTWVRDAIEAKIDDRDIQKTRAGIRSLIQRNRPDDFFDRAAREACQEMRRRGLEGRPILGFATTIDDAEKLKTAFEDQGIGAGVIHSEMRHDEIEAAVTDYASGKVQALCSVGMIGEGFDAPETVAILNTKEILSRAEYMQMVGRAARSAIGKTHGILIDMGASTYVHGTMNEYIDAQRFVEKGDTTYKAWTKVSDNPWVRAICTGSEVYFAQAVRDAKGQPSFHVVCCSEERTTGSRSIKSVQSRPFSAKELVTFARDTIARHESDYLSLRSRKVQVKIEDQTIKVSKAFQIASEVFQQSQKGISMMTNLNRLSQEEFKTLTQKRMGTGLEGTSQPKGVSVPTPKPPRTSRPVRPSVGWEM